MGPSVEVLECPCNFPQFTHLKDTARQKNIGKQTGQDSSRNQEAPGALAGSHGAFRWKGIIKGLQGLGLKSSESLSVYISSLAPGRICYPKGLVNHGVSLGSDKSMLSSQHRACDRGRQPSS